MSLAVSIDSAIKEAEGTIPMDHANAAARQVIAELREPALRGEVYERVSLKETPLLDEFSMSHVHEVLDALIECLEGRA